MTHSAGCCPTSHLVRDSVEDEGDLNRQALGVRPVEHREVLLGQTGVLSQAAKNCLNHCGRFMPCGPSLDRCDRRVVGAVSYRLLGDPICVVLDEPHAVVDDVGRAAIESRTTPPTRSRMTRGPANPPDSARWHLGSRRSPVVIPGDDQVRAPGGLANQQEVKFVDVLETHRPRPRRTWTAPVHERPRPRATHPARAASGHRSPGAGHDAAPSHTRRRVPAIQAWHGGACRHPRWARARAPRCRSGRRTRPSRPH